LRMCFGGVLALSVWAGWLVGCGAGPGPASRPAGSLRDTGRAGELNGRAADLIVGDRKEAERLVRQALEADAYHGPSHNNLGVIRLAEGDLYEAALSFERAHQLMGGHPGPLVNLGIALERGGRIDEALRQYRAALSRAPDDLSALRAMVRCQIRHGREDDLTSARLRVVAERSTDGWRDWAAAHAAE